MKISVLGAGNIGRFIADHFARDINTKVTVYDYDEKVVKQMIMHHACPAEQKDLSKEKDIIDAIKDADIVINALPSFLGFRALKVAVEIGKNVVDFSYMTEDPRQLHELAKKNGSVVVTDFGFAPGMCHMFVGRAKQILKHITDSIIYVGGLPLNEADEYKIVFNARDVIEEYRRPARIIKDGEVATVQPFDDNLKYSALLPNGRKVNLSGFISDGLRTMTTIQGVDNLVESTLRYHKHFDKMIGLIEDGFFKPENIEQTAKVLAEKWQRGPEDRDMSILNVISTGDRGEVKHMIYDEFDEETNTHSMARVTGFPVIIMAEMIASGRFKKPGVNIPEDLGADQEVFDHVFKKLKEKGIMISEDVLLSKKAVS